VSSPDTAEFLPGYSPQLSEALWDWVDSKRSQVHATATRMLIHDLERARLRADWRAVEETVAKCLTLDPYNETAILAQAEAAAMRGGKATAVSILDRYIAEVGDQHKDIQLPAALLRRRVVERIPDRYALLNPDPPFVGRALETEALTKKFGEAQAGKGSAALVIGEPGIGKSRLSAELARFAELQGAQVQRATCRRCDVDHPLSLFVDIVPQLRQMPGALGCAPDSFAALKRLTDFQVQGHASAGATSDVLFQDLRSALFDLIDSITDERCLIVVVEDLQWLDDASGKILAAMVERASTRRLLFLLNSRPGPNAFLNFIENARLFSLLLGPLDSSASTALLQSVALQPGDRPDPEFVGWCVSVADGNPFFLQELAHQWIETGRRYEVPPLVTKVLDERLSRLTPQALQVLQACAMLGEHSTVGRVEAVLGYPPHELLFAIEEASKSAMLSFPSDAKDTVGGRLQPRHDYLASAATSRLTAPGISFLHSRCADTLEQAISQSPNPAALLWACADHTHRAGDRKRALALRLSCARHLEGVGLIADACRRYEDSLASCTSDEDRLSVLSPLALAHQLNGQWELSKQVLDMCVQMSAKNANGDRHSEFEVALFQARAWSTLNFVTLLDDMMPCVKSQTASPQHRVGVAIVALKVASDVGPSEVLDTIYCEVQPFLGLDEINSVSKLEVEIIYRTMRGKEPLDLEILRQFAKMTRELQGEIAYSHALMSCASACRIAARDEDCGKYIDIALEHAIDHKLTARIPIINLGRIRAHVAHGDWVSARKVLSSRGKYPIARDDTNALAEWDFFDTRVAFEEGRLPTSESGLLIGAETSSSAFGPGRMGVTFALAIRLRLARGAGSEEIRPLVRELEAVHRITRDIGNQDFEAYALFLGLAALGEEARGYAYLRDYVGAYRHSRRRVSADIERATNALTHNDLPSTLNQRCQETAARSTDPRSGVLSDHSPAGESARVNSFEYSGLRSSASQI
jgi:AAA ATPase-like protein